MQPPPRLDLGNPQQPQPQQQQAAPPPPHFPPPPYREDSSAPKPRGGLAKVLPTFITLSAFGGLAVLAWFAYQEGKNPVLEEDIPVIKADAQPFKQEPENPGGEQIPYTDKEVYNSFTSDKPHMNADKAEVIPDAERPIDRAFLKQFAGTGEEEDINPVKQESVTFGAKKVEAEKADADAPLEAKPLPLAKANETFPTPNTGGVEVVKKIDQAKKASEPQPFTTKEEVEPAPKVVAAAKPEKKNAVAAKPKEKAAAPAPAKKETATKKPAAISAGSIRVQLGAFRSDAEATREWKQLQGKHASLLSGLTMMVQKADIPNKGTMFRLQAGPLESTDAARILCKKMVAAGQGCFVAK